MKLTKEQCVDLLQKQAQALRDAGETRYPQRGDFPPETAAAIKAMLGPWPRALEAAGVKPVDPEREMLRQQKRIEKKRRDTQRKHGNSSGNGQK